MAKSYACPPLWPSSQAQFLVMPFTAATNGKWRTTSQRCGWPMKVMAAPRNALATARIAGVTKSVSPMRETLMIRNDGGLAAKVLPAEYVIAVFRMHQAKAAALHLRHGELRVSRRVLGHFVVKLHQHLAGLAD